VGARIRYKIKGRLPFTLAFHATITRAEEDVLSSVELRWRPGTDQAASSLL
jgi:hypothetical protein